MADILAKLAQKSSVEKTLAAGEKIEIRILYADSTVKETVLLDSVPTGYNFVGTIAYSGALTATP